MTLPSRSTAPFLLIDAGNSCIKWALAEADQACFVQQGAFAHPHTCDALSIPVEPDWSNLPVPGSVWISNVAGERCMQRIEILIGAHWSNVQRHAVRAQPYQCGVSNGYSDERQLGSDRWASLIGARAAWPDTPILIATLGTAMTLDMLDADGHFAGGWITPGGHLMMHALGQHTALLPTITPDDDGCAPRENVPADIHVQFATDTQTAVREGCRLAQAALIERVWQVANRRVHTSVRCVLSGGGAAYIRPLLTIETTHCEHLVLKGLMRIAQELSS